MKTIVYKVLVLATFFSFAGCSDLLEEEVISGVSDAYYQTEEGARDLVNACYNDLRWHGSSQAFLAITQFGTDTYWRSPEDKSMDFYNAALSPYDGEIEQVWNTCYRSIYMANLILYYMPKVPHKLIFTTDAEYSQALGEGYFFRAYYYYILVQNFGGVPLELSAAPGDLSASFIRSSAAQVYKQVIADFRQAAYLLKNTDALQYGRITKQAAQHFLAKAFLNRASAVSSEEKIFRGTLDSDADSSAFFAQQVINYAESTSNLALEKDFADVYNVDLANQEPGMKVPETDQASKERILIVQYTKNTELNGYGDGAGRPLPFGGENAQSAWFASEYERIPGMGGRQLEYGRSWNKISPTAHLFDIFGYRTTGNGPAEVGTANDNNRYDSRMYKSFRFAFKAWGKSGDMPKWSKNKLTGDGLPNVNYNPNESLNGKVRYNNSDTAAVMTVERIPTATILANAYKTNYYVKSISQYASSDGVRENIADLKAYFPNMIKYMDPNRTSPNDVKGSRDVVLARLGETYLIAAEGYARSGNLDKSVELVNVIRERAAYHDGEQKPRQVSQVHGGTNDTNGTELEMHISAGDITGTDKLVNFFLDERERELTGEFMRWNDLNRCEKLVERVQAYNIGQGSLLIQPFHKLRPIPQNHIDRLTNAGPVSEEQNPGYY